MQPYGCYCEFPSHTCTITTTYCGAASGNAGATTSDRNDVILFSAKVEIATAGFPSVHQLTSVRLFQWSLPLLSLTSFFAVLLSTLASELSSTNPSPSFTPVLLELQMTE